jgi:hypothetical protein
MRARCKGPASTIPASPAGFLRPPLPMTFSDSFLHHGKIYTVDKDDRFVEAARAAVVTTLPSRALVHDIAGLFA